MLLGFFEGDRLFEPLTEVFLLQDDGSVLDTRNNIAYAYEKHPNNTHITKLYPFAEANSIGILKVDSAFKSIAEFFSAHAFGSRDPGSSRTISLRESITEKAKFVNDLLSVARKDFSVPGGPFSGNAPNGKTFRWSEGSNVLTFEGKIPNFSHSLAEIFHSQPLDIGSVSQKLNLLQTPKVSRALISYERKKRMLLSSALSTALCIEGMCISGETECTSNAHPMLLSTLRQHCHVLQELMHGWLAAKFDLRSDFLQFKSNKNLSALKLLTSDPFSPFLFPENAIQESIGAAITTAKDSNQFLGIPAVPKVAKRKYQESAPHTSIQPHKFLKSKNPKGEKKRKNELKSSDSSQQLPHKPKKKPFRPKKD